MRAEKQIGPSHDRNHIHGLDGIRAFAFLSVLAGHCGLSWFPSGFGVTVFFFLSGYLITTLLRLEWNQTGAISVSHFYIRRAFRIIPPFYCALMIGVLAAALGLTASGVHWKAIIILQLFLTNYSEYLVGPTLPAGLTVLWSLAVEEHFYLMFPCVYRGLLRRGVRPIRQVMLFGGFCILVLAWRSTLMYGLHADWYRAYTGTDTRLDSILFGSIMAIAVNPVIDSLEQVNKRLVILAALGGVAVLIVSIAMRGEMFRQTVRYTIQGLALFPIFFFVIRYKESAVTQFLELKAFTHIGELSYSLYVVHYIVLAAVKVWVRTGALSTLVVTFTLSYVLAVLIRRYVEIPSYRMRNRLVQKGRSTQCTVAKVCQRAAQ